LTDSRSASAATSPPAPGTKVVPASGVDAHNDVVRYAWKIVDSQGSDVMEGLDVAQRVDDGRLQRILMFPGSLTGPRPLELQVAVAPTCAPARRPSALLRH